MLVVCKLEGSIEELIKKRPKGLESGVSLPEGVAEHVAAMQQARLLCVRLARPRIDVVQPDRVGLLFVRLPVSHLLLRKT